MYKVAGTATSQFLVQRFPTECVYSWVWKRNPKTETVEEGAEEEEEEGKKEEKREEEEEVFNVLAI